MHHLSWQQYSGGLPLFGNGLQANVTKDGRLISVLGAPVRRRWPHRPRRAGRSPRHRGHQRRAIATSARRRRSAGADDTAKAVLFQTPQGTRRAWETVTMSAAHPAVHVDRRRDRARALPPRPVQRRRPDGCGRDGPGRRQGKGGHRASAYRYFPSAPRSVASPSPSTSPRSAGSPATATKLSGNNTHTYADTNDNNRAGATRRSRRATATAGTTR